MTETTHLPECPPMGNYMDPDECAVCDALRAMRERTLTEARDAVAATYDEVLGFPPRATVLAAIDALRSH